MSKDKEKSKKVKIDKKEAEEFLKKKNRAINNETLVKK